MSYPAGLQTVTVNCGPYLASGMPLAGKRVVLTPEWQLIHVPTGTVLLSTSIVGTLDAAGTASIVVPASDAAGLNRPNVRYLATFDLGRGVPAPDPFYVLLPAANPVVDLDQLVPVPDSAGNPVSVPAVTSLAGLSGPVTAQQVADALNTGGNRLSDAALGAALGTRYFTGTRQVVLFGHSQVIRNGGPGQEPNAAVFGFDHKGSFNWMQTLLGHPFDIVYDAGFGGDTTASLLARVQSDVINRLPNGGWVDIQIGINDANQTTGLPLATATANIDTLLDMLAAANCRVILNEELNGSAGTAYVSNYISQFNRHLFNAARSRPGVIFVPWQQVWTDPTSGVPVTGYAVDGLHTAAQGAYRLGKFKADLLASTFPSELLHVTASTDPNVVNRNPLALGGQGAGNAPTQWIVYDPAGTAVFTKAVIARPDGRPGNALELVITSGSVTVIDFADATKFSAIPTGAPMRGMCEFWTAGSGTLDKMPVGILFQDSGGTTIGQTWAAYPVAGDAGIAALPPSGVLRTPVMNKPSAASGSNTQLIGTFTVTNGSPAVTVRLGRFGMYAEI